MLSYKMRVDRFWMFPRRPQRLQGLIDCGFRYRQNLAILGDSVNRGYEENTLNQATSVAHLS